MHGRGWISCPRVGCTTFATGPMLAIRVPHMNVDVIDTSENAGVLCLPHRTPMQADVAHWISHVISYNL